MQVGRKQLVVKFYVGRRTGAEIEVHYEEVQTEYERSKTNISNRKTKLHEESF